MSSYLITDNPITHNEYTIHKIIKYKNGIKTECEDFIAEEVPVALIYNGISHVVMMATPSHLESFAIGFSLSERIIQSVKEIKSIQIINNELGIEAHIELQNRAFMQLKEQRRQLVGRTGCGLCGVEHLKQAMKPVVAVADTQRCHASIINQSFNAIASHQVLAERTGCTHAAAWVDPHGELVDIYEDVGRHVALDKLIGARAKVKGLDNGGVFITSRASYEIIQKATAAGVEILFAISAPTALAIRLAYDSGLTLIGFCRNGRATVYSHPHRIINEDDC